MKEKQLNLFDFDDDYSLYQLLQSEFLPGEYYEIEYKSGKEGFPKELWKSYSAFANTNTGIIVIGIKDKRGVFTIEGLTDEQITQYKKQFWDECNNPNTVSINLLKNEDLKVIDIKGKKLLAIRVPFARRTDRPVYLTKNPLGNTYKRNHEGDYRCTDDEVKRMLADSGTELKRDNLILENYTIDDLDPLSIRQFRQLFSSTRAGHPWLALEDIELLKKLSAYRSDRKTKQEGITLAGLLMFGKEDSIKEQEALPDYFPDFRERLSTDEKIRWTDRIYPDGSWECNLLQFYLKVWPKLSSTLPKPFRLDKDERIDESPTHIALREAFVNALVHTDYSLSGNIIIALDTEKFVFSNPGTLLVSLEQYYAGGVSECRNPALQQMFMLIGRAEKAGSGVDKIMTGWQESHWRRPFLELENQPDRVKLTLPMFSVIPEQVLNELNVFFDDVSQLAPDELTALSFCLIEGSISNHRLQYVLNMHSSDITGMLKKLCTDGYLISDNNGRWTIYKLKQKVATSDQKVATSAKVDTSSKIIDNQYKSNKKVATSDQKVATSGKKVNTPDRKVATSIPKNLKKEALEQMILALCKDRYVKKEEIAEQLGKSENYIRNKILPQLLKEGKLEKRYPFTHNHPDQGYKTSEAYAEEL
ncbi:RNA-binding domain-containing protein [Agriterribacter sp.]|uniref:RNA-binding domain-containing protein n=1 Tax=Agriterribacter sp. TaxID=2821509 RepID=UPI002C6C102B|nr:RNA-binding domain-containing protein [Agriterribacter sp.]HRO44826.1 putative DNA binding domain-containing protein [Agriterribacter sp.]HRQ18042.1 putative DNA binding domain-containing protein [Agriterribacter sp.]